MSPERKEKGANIIVALSHSGIGAAQAKDGTDNAAIRLPAVDDIDAILTEQNNCVCPSSTDADWPGVAADARTIGGTPGVIGGFWGSHMGLVDLLLERDAALAYVRTAIGKTDAPLHSYFALMADDPSVRIVSNAQTRYVAPQMAGTA